MANLVWTTWHLGGIVGEAMAVSFPWLMVLWGAVVMRWIGWRPTGLPPGWWWPLPMLVYVGCHMAFLAPMSERAWLDGLAWVWMAAAYSVGLHVMRTRELRRVMWVGLGILTMGVGLLAVYQRLIDPEWLPWGRRQRRPFLERSAGPFGVPEYDGGVVFAHVARGVGKDAETIRGQRVVSLDGGECGVGSDGRVGIVRIARRLVGLGRVNGRLERGGSGRQLGRGLLIVVMAAGLLGVAYLGSSSVRVRVDSAIEHTGEVTRTIMWKIAWDLFRACPIYPDFGRGAGKPIFERISGYQWRM
ncbi:MAG: hypothetical protein J6386_16470 [Candidatus Synoicihabitans palmerolidicus]|nr:hypothetical protein [Candidatus Synoicihabitans palmerolidicus]